MEENTNENTNLERLNQIKSMVSSRDMQIWENVARTMCIKKETEKLRNEITRMESEMVPMRKEKKILEEQLAALSKSLDIERKTLQTSEHSAILQKSLNETLLREAKEMKKKYDETLKDYKDQLQDYRRMYEKNSKGYQDLRKQKIELKKLEVEKKILDGRIEDLENSERQYMEIQKKIFISTVVKFAEYYTLYHKNEKLKASVKESKEEEQKLLKEHFQLVEAVKQKKKIQQYKATGNPVSKIENTETKDYDALKCKKKLDADMVKKFLDEEMLPCSLTSIDSSQRVTNFNSDKSKIKVSDVKIIPPPSPKFPVKKLDRDVTKKIEDAMNRAKQHIAKSGSFQMSLWGFERQISNSSQDSVSGSQNSKNVLQMSKTEISQSQIKQSGCKSKPDEPVSKLAESQSQSHHISQANSSGSQPKLSASLFKHPASALQSAPFGSQFESSGLQIQSNIVQKLTPTTQFFPKQIAKSDTQNESQQVQKTFIQKGITTDDMVGDKPQTSQEKVTNSILKPPTQENSDTVSKFFNSKKKIVTFESQPKKDEVTRFQFSREKEVDNGIVVNNMNIFSKPFFLGNNALNQDGNNTKSAVILPPEYPNEPDIVMMETVETVGTTFGTYGDHTELTPNASFLSPEQSFVSSFVQGHLNSDVQEPETTGFNFSRSQNKSNPFSF